MDLLDTADARTGLQLLRALLAGYASVSDRQELCAQAEAILESVPPDACFYCDALDGEPHARECSAGEVG